VQQPRLLDGVRVLEVAGDGCAVAAKLLADLGAEVETIEGTACGAVRSELSPEAVRYWRGSRRRERPHPLAPGETGVHDALAHALAGRTILVESADPVLRARLGLEPGALAAAHPALVHVSITPFGTTGPRAGWRGSDLVAAAAGGAAHLVGESDDPPVRMAGTQSYVSAGVVAVAGALMALHHASRTGRGQHVDVSVQEAVAALGHICGLAKYRDDGLVPRRRGSSLFASVPSGAYACSDGLVYLIVNRPRHWDALASWIREVTGVDEVLDPMFRGPSSNRIEHRELLDLWIRELAARHDVQAFLAEAGARRLAVTPVQRALEVLADPQLAARGFWRELHGVRVAGSPFGHVETTRAAPSGPPPPPAPPVPRSAAPRPLDGLRVIELTAGMAGPWVGRWMAWAGAEVIRVESHARPDVVRLYVPPRATDRTPRPDQSPWFTDWNAGKRFVALDLEKPSARRVLHALVERADVVVENMLPGVAAKLGASYTALAAVNPRLVMLSTTGFGGTGPRANQATWGPNIEAVSGLATLTGFAHVPCSITQFAYPDALSALHGLVAVLAALHHRDQRGRGAHIDLSQYECLAAALGDVLLAASERGEEPARAGNRLAHAAPHGVFPCAGDDAWCAITCRDDDDWRALGEALGRPGWAVDPALVTAAARVERAAELERALGAWTHSRTALEVAERLQRAGVPAAPVQTIADLWERDPHLAARGAFERVAHRSQGEVVANAIPLHLSATPGRTDFAGGVVGADNDTVVRGLLGLTEEEIAALVAEGALEPPRA
jgi:crotonobetainyl-CoA:carnitine CoA-transferase CaiB-like acyl-CoA transferase